MSETPKMTHIWVGSLVCSGFTEPVDVEDDLTRPVPQFSFKHLAGDCPNAVKESFDRMDSGLGLISRGISIQPTTDLDLWFGYVLEEVTGVFWSLWIRHIPFHTTLKETPE